MRLQTRLDHEQRIEAAIQYIVGNLDEPIDLRDLADHVCFSRFHFHRVFQALVGETVGDLVRRLRLERAAMQLRTTDTSITEVAFDAGYATHEAFIRAFRAAFGCTPSDMRRRIRYEGRLPSLAGIHFDGPVDIQFVRAGGEIAMNVEIREAGPRKAVCIEHRGPYYMIGQTFGRLGGWLKESRVQSREGIGIYYDDPQATPPAELRSDAGAIVANDFATDDPQVHVVDIPAGRYAVATYAGTYDGLPGAWGELCGKWMPSSGHTFGTTPSFEIYLNDCSTTAPADLRTELWVPLAG